jgi:hypothetical protein
MSTLDDLVQLIGDLEYGQDTPKAALNLAHQIEAAIIYGYSYDGILVEGTVADQARAYGGGKFYVDDRGFLPLNPDLTLGEEVTTLNECRKLVRRFNRSVKVEAIEEQDGYYWQYKTDWPHRTFEITKDGEPWCRGIVFLFPKSERLQPQT